MVAIFVQGHDVTEEVRASGAQKLLINELNHRVKNTLATVQAIVGSTARTTSSIDEFYQGFVGRIVSAQSIKKLNIKADIKAGVTSYSAWNMVLDMAGKNSDMTRPWPLSLAARSMPVR